ncbi:unnamed protein product [Arabidopsis thaliana]|uniref:Expressed protein n=2 Tax=Arabidopsis thaliana TaxID=3702 RepID=Q8GWC0_ARATH|nr:uncharacterized protein AT2G14247 [Arabidopsis thaliana]AAO63955.1 unknown protein [Arabidopsis thaliana]AEC06291.1 Expressed protein [Arabidopsis thaliana]CAA0361200.1 unnamed protein product [Arabidopsis thaliana]CAD5318476.1 unnamed protein product [Arabidopsis thaliana]VYS52354.1 unnamed protein product [Arabidopsis thaliana]|eukprot:NP_973452.1 Expressed protein [Arabidopsis thaliana]
MAPSAAMLILSHPLVSHKAKNQSLSSPSSVKSTRVFGFLWPWKALDNEDHSAVVLGRLFGDPATIEKRFQEALEQSCW